jgi:hypothetical protein
VIHLVKYFLRRSHPKIPLIACLGVSIWCLCKRSAFSAPGRGLQDWQVILMSPSLYVAFLPFFVGEVDEFDLALAAGRRRLYAARILAALLIVVSMAVCIGLAAWAAGVFREGRWEPLRFFANSTLPPFAMFLATTAFVARAKPRDLELAMGSASLFFGPAWILLFIGLWAGFSSFLPAVIGAIVAVPAWFMGYRFFAQCELGPKPDSDPEEFAEFRAGYADHKQDRTHALAMLETGDEPGLLDALPPLPRVLARTLWLRWSFLWAFGMAAICCFSIICGIEVPIGILFYGAIGVSLIPQLSGDAECSLLPFVSRRTIFGSTLGPIAATPALVGGIAAVVSNSAQIIVWGLLAVLFLVGLCWLVLPSRREYGRPWMMRLRSLLAIFTIVGYLACTTVTPIEQFLQRWLSAPFSFVVQCAEYHPLLASCLIVVAIALLWWRCERKFRYFEPCAQATPSP